ncbi:MAG: hypothetical protein WC637_21665, partial [Victivallales bacterium]
MQRKKLLTGKTTSFEIGANNIKDYKDMKRSNMSNNSLKRVLGALALEQSDLIPFHAYESPEHVMAQAGRMVHEMYLDPELFIEAMIHCSHLYHNDIVAMRNDPFLLIEALTHKYECTEYGNF